MEMRQAVARQLGKVSVRNLRLSLIVVLTAVVGVSTYGLFHRPLPQYCWLVFGPESQVRILVRVDGDALSLTHFLNGEPSGRRERFRRFPECKDVSLTDPDAKTSYLITRAGRTCDHKPGDPTQILFHVDIKGTLNFRQYCDITALPCEPDSAPLAHFHGPLTVDLYTLDWKPSSEQSLKRGGEPSDLLAKIGTFDRQKHCWVVVRFQEKDAGPSTFPKELYPFVDVEFPPKDTNDAPIKRRYPLPDLLSGVVFHGPVPVPDEAGNGIAKLRLSFDSWKDFKVAASSTFELPIANEDSK
jgi:hypothetical protein